MIVISRCAHVVVFCFVTGIIFLWNLTLYEDNLFVVINIKFLFTKTVHNGAERWWKKREHYQLLGLLSALIDTNSQSLNSEKSLADSEENWYWGDGSQR